MVRNEQLHCLVALDLIPIRCCPVRGQDEGSLFITVYAPGMKYEDSKIAVNDTHFKINGPNPTVSHETEPELAVGAVPTSPQPAWPNTDNVFLMLCDRNRQSLSTSSLSSGRTSSAPT